MKSSFRWLVKFAPPSVRAFGGLLRAGVVTRDDLNRIRRLAIRMGMCAYERRRGLAGGA